MALLFASDEDRNGDLDAWFASGARNILARPSVRDQIARSVRRIYQVGTGAHDVFDGQVESSLELNIGLVTDPDQAYSDNTRDRLQATPMLSLRDVDEGIDIVHLTRGTRPELLTQAGIANQMKRSRAQIVYGHTPMAVYSYQGGRAVVRSVGVRADPIRGNLDLVDLRSVVPRISHLIRQMSAFKRLGGPKNWHDAVADQLELVRPGIVFCKLFPTVLRCQQDSCQNVWEFDPERDDLKCPVCLRQGRRMKDGRVPIGTQIRHVAIHYCGKMEPLRVQRCPRHPGDPMRLDTVNQRVANWRWECTKCDFKDQPIQVCFDCRQAVEEPDDGVGPTEEIEGTPMQGAAQ